MKSEKAWNYEQFLFSNCDRFKGECPYGWEQPILSLRKLLKSSSQYSLWNIIEGKQAKAGFVIISAEKEEYSQAENNKKTEELEERIVQEEYSFKKALGGYTYEGADGYTKEKSFVVFNYYRGGEKGDFKDLKNFAVEMCGEFDQQSVLVAEPGKKPVYLDRNGNAVSDVENSGTGVSVNKKDPPAYTSFKTAKSEKKVNPETGEKERVKLDLPDRYETMDIAWSSVFFDCLNSKGITHLGIVDSTAAGTARSAARGMVVYC